MKKKFIDDTVIKMVCAECQGNMISIGHPSGKRWSSEVMKGIMFTCERCDIEVIVNYELTEGTKEICPNCKQEVEGTLNGHLKGSCLAISYPWRDKYCQHCGTELIEGYCETCKEKRSTSGRQTDGN